MTASNACGDGEPVAWWSPEMYESIRRIAWRESRRRRVEFDDAQQEIRLALLQREATRPGPIGPAALYRIARDSVVGYARSLRRARKRDEAEASGGRVVNPTADPATLMDVRDAIGRLRPIDAAVIGGRFLEFRSFAELAEASGRTVGGVRTRQHLAFDALRSGLEASYGPGEARIRSAARKRGFERVGRRGDRFDWTTWGRIPNQREDD